MKKIKKQIGGYTMPFAMIIMFVILILSLLLLLVAYNLFATVNRSDSVSQCREMAQDTSEAIRREIETDVVLPTNTLLDPGNEGLNNGALSNEDYRKWLEFQYMSPGGDMTGQTWYKSNSKSLLNTKVTPLWVYLRKNLLTSDWPYYNDEEVGHGSKFAFRDFTLDGASGTDTAKILGSTAAAGSRSDGSIGVTVTMYCKSEAQPDTAVGNFERTATFVSIVTCKKAGEESSTKTIYDMFFGGALSTGEEYNSEYERWSFKCTTRE